MNRTTFQIVPQVDDHRDVNFPPEEWSRDPTGLDELIAAKVKRRYWIFDPPSGGNLRERTPAEKAEIDATASLVLEARSERRQELFSEVASFIDGRYPSRVRAVFTELRVGASGAQLQRLNEYFAWHRSVWSAYRDAASAVSAATDVASIETIAVDFAPFVASDPNIGPDLS